MQLSDRQQQTIASALTVIAGLVIVAAVLGLFWVLAVFVSTFSHVLLPLAVAGIGALVFQPYYNWLRIRLPMPLAVAALFLSVLIPIGLFVGFFGVVIVRELVGLFAEIPAWWDRLLQFCEEYWPEVKGFFTEHPVGQKLTEMLRGAGPMVSAALEHFASTSVAAGTSVAGWTGALLSWAVAPVYFVFILTMKRKDVSRLEDYLPFLKPDTRQDVVFLVREFVNIVVAFFRGQFIIAFLQGVLLAIGFSLVGLKYGLVLGFLLGFLNVIPYLGQHGGIDDHASAGLLPGERRVGDARGGDYRAARRADDRRLRADSQNHGRPDGAASHGHHLCRLFLGFCARRHFGDDPGHSLDRLPGRLLAPGQGKIHPGTGVAPSGLADSCDGHRSQRECERRRRRRRLQH